MVARSLMLELHRAGHIELPAQRFRPPNNAARHQAPELELALAAPPQECSLAQLGPLEIRQVRRTPAEKLFGSLLEAHHYLRYTQPVGEHLKYLVYAQGQPISALAFSSAPRHLGPRDRFIGWSGSQRRANIHLLAYNTRYLLMPWVKVPHLASHVLARVPDDRFDWQIFTGIRFIYWRPSSTRNASAARVTERPTGSIWPDRRRGKDDQTRPNRSLKRCGSIRCSGAFVAA
jgi:hypothetical protein